MDKPFPAYRGSEPYVFVCYAHLDSESVYSDLIELNKNKISVWYDEGIPAGSSWRGEIAAAIKTASKLVFFISKSSLASAHCLREVDFALNNDIAIIPVYLDDSVLPGELELALNRVQALFKKSDSLYMEHLVGAIKGRAGITSLGSRPKRSKPKLTLIAVLAGLSLLSVITWTQRDMLFNEERLESGLLSSPSSFDRYLQGLEYIRRWDKDDNLDSAIAAYTEAIELNPDFALAYARLAEAYRIRSILTGEDSWLDEAARNVDAAMRLNPDLAPVQVSMGRVNFTRGNIDLAFAAIETALDLDQNDAEANMAMASILQRQGRPDDAASYYQKAVFLDPENLLILDSYANFLIGQGNFAEATEQWQTVIRLAPDHFAALVNLGTALDGLGRSSEAITMYQRAIEIRPTYMAYSNLGTAYSRADRYQDAIAAYRQAVAINNSDWLAWGNLAIVLFWDSGMSEEAMQTFGTAIALAEAARASNTRDPWVHSDLALYYARTGQQELALQRLGAALVLSPDIAEILAAAAETYEILGDRDKAIEFALQAIEQGFPLQQLQRSFELRDLLQDPRMQSV